LNEIYLAPPDRHLLIAAEHVRVTRGPQENRFRPAIDPLFRTAAREHGSRVVGIILSGGQHDGVAGLKGWPTVISMASSCRVSSTKW
jgi:two-component system, chemotaxis family, protein-glutamate methylesterase/glutaminase